MKIFTITKHLSPHGSRLERWLGADKVESISKSMMPWYGPPIAVSGVPGNIWAHKGGDFGGIIKSGQFLNAVDFSLMKLDRIIQRVGLRQRQQLNAGFTSLSDLIHEATTGKRRDFQFNKVTAGATAGASYTLWSLANLPAAGAAGSAAPGGRAPDSTTLGGFPFTNPAGGDTQHFTTGFPSSTVAANTLLLYDRIFDVAKTMNSTATESVTGVPTRYQSSTSTDMDYAGGNFAFIEVQTTNLAATAHNWTVCQYRNQDNTDSVAFPSLAGISAAAASRLDMPLNYWFMPLASGDTGVKDLDQMQCSALVAVGAINFVIGHPLAWMPCPVANMVCVQDGINTAFNLVRIFDDACMAFLDVNRATTAAATYAGSFTTVAG